MFNWWNADQAYCCFCDYLSLSLILIRPAPRLKIDSGYEREELDMEESEFNSDDVELAEA